MATHPPSSLTIEPGQDWAEFIDFAAAVVDDLDAGRIGEAEAVQRMRPAVLYNIVLDAILLRHRPEVIRPLMYQTRLPGESEEEATARWARAGVRTLPRGAGHVHVRLFCWNVRRWGEGGAAARAEPSGCLHVWQRLPCCGGCRARCMPLPGCRPRLPQGRCAATH
jgi:hypothetical protein